MSKELSLRHQVSRRYRESGSQGSLRQGSGQELTGSRDLRGGQGSRLPGVQGCSQGSGREGSRRRDGGSGELGERAIRQGVVVDGRDGGVGQAAEAIDAGSREDGSRDASCSKDRAMVEGSRRLGGQGSGVSHLRGKVQRGCVVSDLLDQGSLVHDLLLRETGIEQKVRGVRRKMS